MTDKEELDRADRETLARFNDLKALCAEFGWQLRAFDPGVLASDDRGSFDFGGAEWNVVEPLLRELVELRRTKNAEIE